MSMWVLSAVVMTPFAKAVALLLLLSCEVSWIAMVWMKSQKETGYECLKTGKCLFTRILDRLKDRSLEIRLGVLC